MLRLFCARQRPLCSSWASPDDPVQALPCSEQAPPPQQGWGLDVGPVQPQSIQCHPCAAEPQVTPAPCSRHCSLWSGPQRTSPQTSSTPTTLDTWRWRRSSPRPPPSLCSSLLFNSKVLEASFIQKTIFSGWVPRNRHSRSGINRAIITDEILMLGSQIQ